MWRQILNYEVWDGVVMLTRRLAADYDSQSAAIILNQYNSHVPPPSISFLLAINKNNGGYLTNGNWRLVVLRGQSSVVLPFASPGLSRPRLVVVCLGLSRRPPGSLVDLSMQE
jgi:hypothetical protein